jgi:hypothetical protein
MKAQFGNPSPRAPGDYPADPVTEVEFPDGVGTDEAFITMTAPDGVVANQAGTDPSWVAAEDEDLAVRLGEHYGCEVRPYGEDSQ